MHDGDRSDYDGPTVNYRVRMLEATLSRHGERIELMEDRWLRLDGAFSLMKLTIGTSIASSIVAIVSIIALVSGQTK